MIVFDDIDIWQPSLTDVLTLLVPPAFVEEAIDAAPETIQDACELVLGSTCREMIMDATLGWISSKMVAGYHGTRLTETEVNSVRTKGLMPLRANCRYARLQNALSFHERWPDVADKLNDELRAFGPGEKAGRREGQVHLTLSRSGLVRGFNQYLTHGADIDRHIASTLLGHEGVELLGKYGKARVIEFAVPGHKALAAANPYWSIEECLASDKVPNLIRELLGSWSYRVAHPGFQSSSLGLDCGMIFWSKVPSDWIVAVETIYKE